MGNILTRLSDRFEITLIITAREAIPELLPENILWYHEPMAVSDSQRAKNKRSFFPEQALSPEQTKFLFEKYNLSDYTVLHTAIHSFSRLAELHPRVLYGINDSLSKSSLNGSLKGKLKYRYYRAVENKISKLNCTFSVVSEKDAESYSGAETLILPNGVDFDAFSPHANKPVEDHFVFHGVLDYQVNIDSICHMADILNQASPDYRLKLIGRMNRSNKEETKAIFNRLPNCDLIGEVDSIPEEITRFRFYLALMSSGAGIKNKILEAMSCGMVVLINDRAAEGLLDHNSLTDAVYLIKKPADIKAAFTDKENWQTKGTNARNYILKHYSWDSYMSKLEAFYLNEKA